MAAQRVVLSLAKSVTIVMQALATTAAIDAHPGSSIGASTTTAGASAKDAAAHSSPQEDALGSPWHTT